MISFRNQRDAFAGVPERNAGPFSALRRLENYMDIVAINDLRARYLQAVRSAETYRQASEKIPPLREFYHALATTHERMAREANLMLEKVERLTEPTEQAA